METGLEIYKAINAIMADLVKQGGISKDRQNQQQHYSFRGIDDVLNVLAPMLVKHQVCILPNVVSRTCEMREAKSGGTLFYTTVECDFVFVSAVDGSRHVVHTFGEAMDSGDKSTNKAMSAAMKYACILGFCIPTEVEDADATDPEPTKAQSKTEPQRAPVSVGVTTPGIGRDAEGHATQPNKPNGNGAHKLSATDFWKYVDTVKFPKETAMKIIAAYTVGGKTDWDGAIVELRKKVEVAA